MKVTLREPGTRLRGQTPELAYQELWALLTVYNALVRLAVTTAVNLNVDPDQVSFTAVLALTRNVLAADRGPCVNCGHLDPDPVTALITAIAGQPLNRHDRQRNGPRTPAQRETERTRDVTYEITIAPARTTQNHQISQSLGQWLRGPTCAYLPSSQSGHASPRRVRFIAYAGRPATAKGRTGEVELAAYAP